MRYYRLTDETGASRLIARTDETAYDLTAATEDLGTFTDLARAAALSDQSIDDVARLHIPEATELAVDGVVADATRPVAPDEVWAIGGTYNHVEDEEAFREEYDHADLTLMVYDPENPPELFFKGTARRTVGPSEAVGIRSDVEYNVAEPELALILHRGDIVGYTVGNDMSASGLLRRNPLYLSATKIFSRCCSIGPAIASAESIPDPHDLEIRMTVERDGEIIFEDAESTEEMLRAVEDLPSHITEHDDVAELTVLLTGGPFAPADTLQEGDQLVMEIDGIGRLENHVTPV
ncbi:fumarylacetoacetate hydrolase family protein [Halovenus marina]|uniref:fumarylacetoacetate hydrolase family protein n=1 Tax=Halovenus marina TaxID=3396621 RepID=UPI003F552346